MDSKRKRMFSSFARREKFREVLEVTRAPADGQVVQGESMYTASFWFQWDPGICAIP